MGIAFTYQGASGRTYEFLMVDLANPKALPWHAGVFTFAAFVPKPLYFGEGANLYQAMTASFGSLFENTLPRTIVAHLRLEPGAAERAATVADLVEMFRPPLNRQK